MNSATWLLAVPVAAVILIGCGASDSSDGTLSAQDVTPILRSLPFEARVSPVPPPRGDEAAFLGTARRAGVRVRFSIGIGETAVPLPGLGSARAIGEGSLGFVFNTDGNYVRAFKTGTDWYRAADTATAIEERLCRKVSGEPCPV